MVFVILATSFIICLHFQGNHYLLFTTNTLRWWRHSHEDFHHAHSRCSSSHLGQQKATSQSAFTYKGDATPWYDGMFASYVVVC